ncbi:MAG TPA: MBL fold metallo-hydrolase [Anaerolineales bacterium]|nr:MBL fold metallo-hydrolase [Anaerolineales bacterium]
MKATLWGTRGSLASPGPDTIRYGGNTSCVSIMGSQGTLLVLDAGTGIRCLGQDLPQDLRRVDILLTQLHMDHIQGLPFFTPLRRAGVEVHLYGPASTTLSLHSRLMRYLSPPLFPVSIRELPGMLHFHELPSENIEIGEFSVKAQLIIHPNPTVGYRVESEQTSLTYIPDHEPALGSFSFPRSKEWTSGFDLAEGVDILIHDSQYTAEEYKTRIGFGHSSLDQAIGFAELTGVKQLVTFHHDPSHSDGKIDQMMAETIGDLRPSFKVTAGMEGMEIVV